MIDRIEIPFSLRARELVDLLLVAGLASAAIVWLRGSRARFAFADVRGLEPPLRRRIHLVRRHVPDVLANVQRWPSRSSTT